MDLVPFDFILVLLTLCISFNGAFIPMKLYEVVSLSLTANTHSEITENALLISTSKFFNSRSFHQSIVLPETKVISAEKIFQAYYGKRVSTTAYIKAVQEVVKAVASIDTREDTKDDPTWHFDAEAFHLTNAGLKRMWREMNAAIGGGSYSQARALAGQYLHPLQDFYSHSNWVEMGNTATNDALGVEGAFLGIVADISTPTCSSCLPTIKTPFECRDNILPSINKAKILTSGYYGGESIGLGGSILSKPPGKCSHGGQRDTTRLQPAEGGINKDTTNSFYAPHHYLHPQASAIAQTATVKFFDRLRTAIGDEKFAAFLNIKWPTGEPVPGSPTPPTSRRFPVNVTSSGSDTILLLNVRDMPATKKTIKFKVDSLIESFDVLVGHESHAPSVRILTPDGAVYPSAHALNVTPIARQYRVLHPVEGTWSLAIEAASAGWYAEIRGAGTFDVLCHFELVHTDRHRYAGPEELFNNPLFEQNLILVAQSTCDKCRLKNAKFLHLNGSLLHSITLHATKSDPHIYVANVTIPHQNFNLEVTGTGLTGAPFQRLHSATVTPTQIRLNFTSGDSTVSELKQGFERNVTMEITNEGPAGTFDLSVRDSRHLVTEYQPRQMTLRTGQTKSAFIRVAVPSNAPVGLLTDIVFTVKLRGTSGTNFNFFKKSVSIISGTTDVFPPSCTVIRSNFVETCMAAVSSEKTCKNRAWEAQVEFEEPGSGIDGLFVASSGEENVTWWQADYTTRRDGHAMHTTVVHAAGTCCTKAVHFIMVDRVGLTGQCDLKVESAGTEEQVHQPKGWFSGLRDRITTKLGL